MRPGSANPPVRARVAGRACNPGARVVKDNQGFETDQLSAAVEVLARSGRVDHVTTIRIHFLGGTIGYAGASDGEPERLGAEALLGGVPGLDRLPVTLDVHAAVPVPSASLTFQALADLAREAADACAAGAADAVVVVQGTDTMEESAYLLDLLWDRPEPLVLTGAMRSPTLAGADGPANLLAALAVAADERFRELGALIVLADEVHSARTVQKVHTTGHTRSARRTGGPSASWSRGGRCPSSSRWRRG